MGQKQEIYGAYLKKHQADHPNMIEPEFYGGIGGKDMRELDLTGSTRINGQTRGIPWYCVCDEKHKLADGRIVEMGWTTSGNFRTAYVFPNEEAWSKFDRPMSYNAYFEHW